MHRLPIPTLNRRQLLGSAALGLGAWSLPSSAQTSRSIPIIQVLDTSPSQVDLSKDFVVGARAAWQECNRQGGINGRTITHTVLEYDGSPDSLNWVLQTIQATRNCTAVVGTVGSRLAAALGLRLATEIPDMPHIAPWLQRSSEDMPTTFGIFATWQEQIHFALRSLSSVGVQTLGVVYASSSDQQSNQADVQAMGERLGVQLQHLAPRTNLQELAQQLTESSPRILVFLGGSPELAQWAQGLEQQNRQRYVVALSDVNLLLLQQMGVSRKTPVIATQSVPLPNAPMPLVRNYRDILSKLYDEPASPHSLAGYTSARFALEALRNASSPQRSSVLQWLNRRTPVDLGGLQVQASNQRKQVFVTQTMLDSKGRLIG
ncbi:ABC transporter substrate-binding protein [Curvibacter sp. CHRR-16]|uniref:ABC transporter substrate-binding protein n=1 Tax=Curvibacter sp. CHRR-16 TaxID=2835872 RepID=UPI001BD92E53|nr:ABC transporter substrate-binding protein [Curvibacter sp. CHRR-16]MBT0568719.1 ABC transporter substrate-binding protein [Curvibacter sp. CHRR-16]